MLHVSCPASGGRLAGFHVPWLCLHLHMSLCVSVPKFPLFIRTPIIGLGATPLLDDLILTPSIYDNLFPNKVTF